jgi:hypothetical protein
MAKKKVSLGGDISKSVKGTFSLDKFKAAKGLGTANNTFKEQEWIPLSPAWQEMVSLPGIPHGHITLLRGHSDSGKTTALLEVAVNAQKNGNFTCIHYHRDEMVLGTCHDDGVRS